MREVNTEEIRKTVKDLFLKINYDIGSDVIAALKKGLETEESETGRAVLEQILKNNKIATDEQIAICQDTGFSIIFVKLGQDVRLTGGDFNDAINQGVREAYEEGYLRKSVVDDPLFDRTNTKDNTPAIVHLEIVPGDKIHIEVTAKGGGSENMSAMKVLTPSQGEQGVRDFVVDAVKNAGPNPCPPIVVGVGIGGTIELFYHIYPPYWSQENPCSRRCVWGYLFQRQPQQVFGHVFFHRCCQDLSLERPHHFR
jgi:fumarate hydratase subunit alpha